MAKPFSTAQPHQIETELSRELGIWSALAIGVGTMIAAGIFTLSGLAIRNVGSAAIVSFLLAAIVSSLTALAYCEFVSVYPRSGEGYLYARRTFSPPLAYLVGWSLFLGYTASCAFYIASLSSYFNEFIWHIPYESLSGLLALIALTFLNIKGTKESGGFQIMITGLKVLLLIWFIYGGLKWVDQDMLLDAFSTDVMDIISTSALVFITFFGFSAIAASAGEVQNPIRNIPKAIFISVIAVTILYTFVIVVTLAADLNEYTEAAMGAAAKKFLGGFGGLVIVGGAIFSMISASNASIMAGSRVALAMSHLGHFPVEIGSINKRTKTPIISLLLVGGVIIFFAMALPLEDLAHFANIVLLIALIMVNIALIVHRRKFPDLDRPFRVPFVPVIPIVAIAANAYLLIQIFQHLLPTLLAIGCLVLGMVAFLSWKGTQPEEEAIPGIHSKVALERYAPDKNDKRPRILVPLANPATMPSLIAIAASIARAQNGVIVLLRVRTVPEQMPLDFKNAQESQEKGILDAGQREVERHGLPFNALLKVGHNAARAILETARERHCELIILGWKGYSSSRDKVLGEVTDTIVTYARCNIMLAKIKDEIDFDKVLLATTETPHALVAEKYAAILVKAHAGNLTLGHVVEESTEASTIQQKMKRAQERISSQSDLVTDIEIIHGRSVSRSIIEAGKSYDTIIIGATRDQLYKQILFGSIPENIAKFTKRNVIVVKEYSPVRALLGRVLRD
ncbi:MAG: amino acid permease [Saprospiraceae bacterium]|nr:amino acid permease [Saprospiraceae bacterium]